jgi:hypothetical protein
MNKHWKCYSFVVGSLLLTTPAILAAREPKLQNPCKDLRNDLDSQVNSLHKHQDDELADCRRTNGKNGGVCRDLKNQQQLALRQLRDQRQTDLDRCNSGFRSAAARSTKSNSCDNAAYVDNDRYHHKKHPEPPYSNPPKNPPGAKNPPDKDGNGNGRRGDLDAGATRSAGNSGSSQHGSDHNSGSSSSSSGGSSGSSAGSSSSGSSHSSSSGSSSAPSSSSSSSGNSPSASSSASSTSHSSDTGSRPK